MSGKVNRSIRNATKEATEKLWNEAVIAVLNKLECTAKRTPFFVRLKIALRYLFVKTMKGFMEVLD